MITKLRAAQLATRSGTTVVIAQGARPGVIGDLLGPQGRQIGTWFETQITQVESRKRWLLSEKPQGVLRVDRGAERMLRQHAASLLPVGVTAVEGRFERGVVLSVIGPDGAEIARGLTNYAAADLFRIQGQRSEQIEPTLGYSHGDEVIHRDHLVLL
jgi:glutamate 5-kinase